MVRSLGLILFVTAAGAAPVAAQPPDPKPTSGAPCCGITAIDARTGIVTAQEASTGHVFRFEVKDRLVFRGLKVGQKVFADFATSRVSVGVDPERPCCTILGGATDNPGLRQPAAAACCAITAIDPATGVVTARITANGRSFRFQVTDPALLATLKVGDKVWASGATRKAGLIPGERCCGIVGPLPAGMP